MQLAKAIQRHWCALCWTFVSKRYPWCHLSSVTNWCLHHHRHVNKGCLIDYVSETDGERWSCWYATVDLWWCHRGLLGHESSQKGAPCSEADTCEKCYWRRPARSLCPRLSWRVLLNMQLLRFIERGHPAPSEKLVCPLLPTGRKREKRYQILKSRSPSLQQWSRTLLEAQQQTIICRACIDSRLILGSRHCSVAWITQTVWNVPRYILHKMQEIILNWWQLAIVNGDWPWENDRVAAIMQRVHSDKNGHDCSGVHCKRFYYMHSAKEALHHGVLESSGYKDQKWQM